MNFINLRNVTNQEINESYCGILRISPNEFQGVLLDDPTPLLYSIGNKIKLSDSVGNFLNISFIPQTVPTEVYGDIKNVNLVNITQEINGTLYCTKSLNLKSILYISPQIDKAPIQVVTSNGILLYPIDAPDDTRYLNYNSKRDKDETLGYGASEEAINKFFDNIWADDPVFTDEYDDYHVKVNGNKVYRLKPASEVAKKDEEGNIIMEQSASMVPELYKHDYVLGQCAGHTYKMTPGDINENLNTKLSKLPRNIKKIFEENNVSSKITELSFVEIEKIIWPLLGGSIKDYYRSFEGRYKNLYPKNAVEGTENDLYNTLFANDGENDEILEDYIRSKAPLLGIPVQSGLIFYNAIPARRFLFHTLRRYENLAENEDIALNDGSQLTKNILNDFITASNGSSSLFMHNLTTEYALCDGKRIKEINGEKAITDYPAINKLSSNWKNWKGVQSDNNASNVYDAMALSMPSQDSENKLNILRTPRLFEMDQLSLRYLRGLNWQRVAKYNKVVDDELLDTEEDFWPYNQEEMVIESDGTYIINDWYNEDKNIRPEIEGDINYTFIHNKLKHQLPDTDLDDEANIIKDIHKVGIYYANYDYKLAYAHRHIHQLVVNEDLLKNYDTLYKARNYYMNGTKTNLPGENDEEINNKWKSYVKLEAGSESFLSTYVMRSMQAVEDIDLKTLKEIQDLPISYRGGTTSSLRRVVSGYKGARAKLGRCTGNYEKRKIFYLSDGGYELTTFQSRKDGTKEGWRFLSSLPAGINKYGKWSTNEIIYATANYNGTEIKIDDGLPNPPAINLLPLMKI